MCGAYAWIVLGEGESARLADDGFDPDAPSRNRDQGNAVTSSVTLSLRPSPKRSRVRRKDYSADAKNRVNKPGCPLEGARAHGFNPAVQLIVSVIAGELSASRATIIKNFSPFRATA